VFRRELILSDELDINLELLYLFEKRHLFPHFVFHHPVDLAKEEILPTRRPPSTSDEIHLLGGGRGG